MKCRSVLILIILLVNAPFLYSQETDNPKSKLYNELINTEIPIVNQKKTIKLKDFENKVIIVILFASWCNPCIQQAKDLNSVQTGFQKENLFIIGLNVDSEEREDFSEFLKHNKFNYLMGFANEDLFKSAAAVSKKDAIPQTIIIHQGEIKEIYVGGGRTTEKVRKILNDIFIKN